MTDILQEKLARLLGKAQAAHHDFEAAELDGVFDEQRPAWFAEFLMANGLAGLLGKEPDLDSLAAQLNEISQRHKAERTAEPWADHTAHSLLKSTL